AILGIVHQVFGQLVHGNTQPSDQVEPESLRYVPLNLAGYTGGTGPMVTGQNRVMVSFAGIVASRMHASGSDRRHLSGRTSPASRRGTPTGQDGRMDVPVGGV